MVDPLMGFDPEFRVTAAAVAIVIVVVVLVLVVVFAEGVPARVSFMHYARSGSSNYAVLVITNVSDRTVSFTSHNTSPKGTAQHVVSLRRESGWSEPVENKPVVSGGGFLFAFAMVLPPQAAQTVKVPVDEVPRRVALPVYVTDMKAGEVGRLEEWRSALRRKVRQVLRIKDSPAILVWCPTELKLPEDKGRD